MRWRKLGGGLRGRSCSRRALGVAVVLTWMLLVAVVAYAGDGEHATAPAVPENVALREAAVSMPVAALLGAALAFRPRRRGTPPRSPEVAQTQILLSLVGALVMLVVGASLARAFGIVGAASLVRYRSKVGDPKDAGVMLCCLALGLAAGVGIYFVAAAAAAFILAVVWVLESLEPERQKELHLRVKGKEPGRIQKQLEQILQRNGARHDLRTSSQDELTYWVELPFSKKTTRLTTAIAALAPNDDIAVDWSDKKPKDS